MSLYCKEGLIQIISSELDLEDRISYGSLLNQCFDNHQSSPNQETLKSWLQWAKSRSAEVRVISTDIPKHILNTEATIYDIRVFTKHGPDDSVYDKHEEIRQQVARGNSLVELDVNGKSHLICFIHALKKFTGGLGDDDDRVIGHSELVWERYFIEPIGSSKKVVALNKANGEAAHISARWLKDKFVFCCGSKNVHMVFCDKVDIGNYTESRYEIARIICHAFLDKLNRMEIEKQNMLLSFLHYTEFTAVCEILQPNFQHVENLSNLKLPELHFIAWTSTDVNGKASKNLTGLPPDLGIEVAKFLQFETVKYEVCEPSEAEEKMLKVRSHYGYEGKVFYFLNENNAVIGLIKKKTIWYVLIRALREKLKHACNPGKGSLNDHIKKTEKRFKEIQRWLNLSHETTEEWSLLATKCIKWCSAKVRSNEVELKQISSCFPVVWNKFLEDTGESDEIIVKFKS